MDKLAYAQALVSTAFRVTAYVFLEMVPARAAVFILLTLYMLYLVLSCSQPTPLTDGPKQRPKAQTDGKSATTDTKGDISVSASIHVETSSNALSTIIFSLPSPYFSLRLVNLIINTLLCAAAFDFVLNPYFEDAADLVYTRVGAVYPDAAKIVVRYPAINSTHNTVRIAWRQVSLSDGAISDAWRDGPAANLSQGTDWVSTVKLDSLWPSTTYEFRLEDANRTLLPYPASPIRFHTFPDPLLHSGSHFRFLASSCIVPNFPYVPLQGRRIKGFDLLADYLGETSSLSDGRLIIQAPRDPKADETPAAGEIDAFPSPIPSGQPYLPMNHRVATASTSTEVAASKPSTEFMIFMGDFIYADVPLHFGDNKETYRRLYRRNYQSDSFRRVYEQLPIIHTCDDQEIINNYAGQANGTLSPFPNADNAFQLYNAHANYESPSEGQHYYEFRYGDTAFFVMDTRRYRSIVEETDEASRTMLGEQQLAAFYDWLGRVNNTATFKFIVTSVPFTSLWQHDAQTDSWAGFAYEKAALLNAFRSVPNVILLSGDRHEFATIQFESEDPGYTVYEISTSPLNMFYVPFFRTLKMQSDGVVQKAKEVARTTENGTVEILTITEDVPQERALRYIAEETTNGKSSIEVDARDQNHPIVQVEILIDGSVAYSLTIHGQPVVLQSSTALGAYVPQSFKGMLDKIGLNPSRWF